MKSVLSLPDYPRISDREFVIARKEVVATTLQLRLIKALSKQQVTSLRSLKVVVSNGEATISGKVDSYYLRQIAVNACLNTWGLLKLVDRIEVRAT